MCSEEKTYMEESTTPKYVAGGISISKDTSRTDPIQDQPPRLSLKISPIVAVYAGRWRECV
jgi:hypothetical protein